MSSPMCDDCNHPGKHVARVQCPECGRFASHGWSTSGFYGPNGFDMWWGGTCKTHGYFSESVA